jgi:hypothetical protein
MPRATLTGRGCPFSCPCSYQAQFLDNSVYNGGNQHQPMKMPSTNLVQVLIGKSIVETVLVGSLAIIAFLSVLPPYFHGWGEVTEDGIAGWAVDNGSPWERVEVQLFIDGKFFDTGVANRSRPDVSSAGWALDEWHGYSFVVHSLSPGPHEARVYALRTSGNATRKSLQLLGTPIPFIVGNEGKLRPPAGK